MLRVSPVSSPPSPQPALCGADLPEAPANAASCAAEVPPAAHNITPPAARQITGYPPIVRIEPTPLVQSRAPRRLRQRLSYRLGKLWEAAGGDLDEAVTIHGGVRCPARAAAQLAASGYLAQAAHIVKATGRHVEQPDKDEAVLALAVSLMLADL